ncbi:thymidine phosphorylase [Epibacterium ulvae]|uniref:Thymidine phosphorylase n=1 Tax=Epibacterium ulvae TaxID=1156985 RepID=A0A1G5Q0B9_9RHOB|nr:thymidine phosphorylase [Epibacterium ulvae]SCZ54930.1 thymidine phosphorylase [Epibacterium ulvae]
MDARAIIAGLRQGEQPDAEQLNWFAQGLADGRVSDAQAGAFAMAVCLQGLKTDARSLLTRAMRDTGDVLTWGELDGPVLDKHSTGGVGDCVSLLLAPALAECGAYVPMISGRGLGHTGGTLDKLEAIPGVSTQVDEARLRRILQDVGCAIVGATSQIAPADKRLYAIRDVTGTVESIDLITASILSKKLAASPDVLVLDVKVGSGAFMKSLSDARALAKSLADTANAAGCKTSAFISDMSQPLAASLGNALEVREVMQALTSGQDNRLVEITCALGGALLADGGLAENSNAGAAQIAAAIRDGRAAERFARMIAALGGPADFLQRWEGILPVAPVQQAVFAGETGYIASIDGEALGLAVVSLGGGRQVEEDHIDPSVGLSGLLPLGAVVTPEVPLAVVHAADTVSAEAAALAVRRALTIGAQPPVLAPLVHERIA